MPTIEKSHDEKLIENGHGKTIPLARMSAHPKPRNMTHKLKRPTVDIEFHDLVYKAKAAAGTKTILDSVSGSFECGKLSAIMGPSGAGKTTLMNLLIGYVASEGNGTILANGKPRNPYVFNKLNSYIMQEDLLRPHLSVYESLLISAHLKLGNQLSDAEKIEVVNEIMCCMSLEECKNTRTHCLSGGQRKRTSIALELVSNPSILFLDEPTSGLDTVTTTRCLQLLKDLARQGRTVVCTLHQPSSSLFYMLDHVYFMSNGKCIYQGSPHYLVSFLADTGLVCKSTYNPADYILEVITENEAAVNDLSLEISNGKLIKTDYTPKELPDGETELTKKYSFTALPSEFTLRDDTKEKYSVQFPTSFLSQFLILYKRKMIIQRRDTTSLWIMFIHHVFSAFVVGAIFYNVGNDGNRSRPFENFKFYFSVFMFFLYTYAMIPALLLPDEMKLLEREYFNRWYSLKAYFMVTLISTLIPMLVFGSIFLVIVYVVTDQPLEWHRFILFSFAMLLSANISEGYGVVIGSLLPCTTGSILTPMVLVPQVSLGIYGLGYGQYVEPFMNFCMSLSYVRTTLVACSLALYENRPELYCPVDPIGCLYKNPGHFLRDLGMADNVLAYQLIALVIFYVLIRILTFVALRCRLNKELYNAAIVLLTRLSRKKI